MVKLSYLRTGVLALAGAAAIAAGATNVAQAQQGSDVPILVMGEDSDPLSVPRSSDIFRRVVTMLQQQMSRYNFYVVDEEMIAVQLGWQVRERRPKTELIQVVELSNQSGDPRIQTRAMVIFKIMASGQSTGFGGVAKVRIDGDTYDYAARRYLNGWEYEKQFPAPAACFDPNAAPESRRVCIYDVVGAQAREIAATLGDVLRKQLNYLTQGPAAPSGPAPAAAAPGGMPMPAATGPAPGLTTTYAITFRNFTTREIMEIKGVMESEFPHYVTSRAPTGDTAVMRYGYVSQAPAHKIVDWINMLLMDMGLDPDRQVKVIARDQSSIEIDKIFGDPVPTRAAPGGRFR